MTDFEARDETELYDVRAFGAVEAQRRRDEREAAQGDAAQDAVSGHTVAAADLEPGMVIVSAEGLGAVVRLCSDLEPPHTVRVWLESTADDAPLLFSPDAGVDVK